MDLSIIIVNWNSTDYLRACLASVYRYTRGIAFEIIVIDNASTDNCEQVILREFPEVIFISSTDNLGFACANNRAVVRSSGELLLFLNPDTEIAGNVLAEMVRHLRAHPKAGAAGVRLLNSDGSVQLSCIQAFPTLINQVLDSDFLRRRMPRSRLWGMQALFSGSQSHSDVEAISGACFMIRREVFEAVGHFTEAYFMYVEDLELSYRVKHAGHAIHYLGACEVVHHGGKSSAQREDYFASLRQRQAMLTFFERTKGHSYARTYAWVSGLSAVARLALLTVVAPFRWMTHRGKSARFALLKWWKIAEWAFAAGRTAKRVIREQPAPRQAL